MKQERPKGVRVYKGEDPHYYETLKKEVEANRTTSEWKELMARNWKPAVESRPKVKASEIKRLKPDTVCVVVSMPPFPHTVKISVEAFHRCSSCCSITVVKELNHWPDAKPRKSKK